MRTRCCGMPWKPEISVGSKGAGKLQKEEGCLSGDVKHHGLKVTWDGPRASAEAGVTPCILASLPECLVLASASRRMLSQLGVWTGPLLLVFMDSVSFGNLRCGEVMLGQSSENSSHPKPQPVWGVPVLVLWHVEEGLAPYFLGRWGGFKSVWLLRALLLLLIPWRERLIPRQG